MRAEDPGRLERFDRLEVGTEAAAIDVVEPGRIHLRPELLTLEQCLTFDLLSVLCRLRNKGAKGVRAEQYPGLCVQEAGGRRVVEGRRLQCGELPVADIEGLTGIEEVDPIHSDLL